MSVNCLNQEQKNFITVAYRAKHKNQKQLAEYLNVSERTINRVLIEVGMATPVARIKGEAHQVMQLLYKNKMDFNGLKQLLKITFGSRFVE